MKLKNDWYDVMKWLSLIAIDAVGLFVSRLSAVFGWGIGADVVEICAAVSALIGTLIGISTAEYRKEGELNGHQSEN